MLPSIPIYRNGSAQSAGTNAGFANRRFDLLGPATLLPVGIVGRPGDGFDTRLIDGGVVRLSGHGRSLWTHHPRLTSNAP
jgi:hypothetical protein